MKTAPRLLNWIEDNHAQIWFDAKVGWTCFHRIDLGEKKHHVIQPTHTNLREAIRMAMAETQAFLNAKTT